jgi:RNA polymerase sigma-70 factor, ECF subfamily
MGSTQDATTCSVSIAIPAWLGADLYGRAGAEKFGLAPADFTIILQAIVAKYLPHDASQTEIVELLTKLKLEDLALARSCARGNQAAWEVFLNRYREKLYRAAYSITSEESTARELADSVYADLYGTKTSDGRRVSKLDSFTGRGSLEGWLRAVLAQDYVNRFRKQQHTVSLDEQLDAGAQLKAEEPNPAQALDPRLEEATDQALASLAAEDKFILARHFLDGRTLAEIARLLGVHESTVSRRIEKITTSLRKSILAALAKSGMSSKEARQTMEVEVSEFSLNVRGRLAEPAQEEGSQTVP